MLLAVLAVVFALGAPGVIPLSVAAAAPTSQLPPTQPGLNRDEGVFLITIADDGSRAIFFVAGSTRHSILASDLQLELELNPLWPMRPVSPDEALLLPEEGPIGAAKTGLLKAPAPPEAASDSAPEPAAAATQLVAPAAEAEATAVPTATPAPITDQPAATAPSSPTLQPAATAPSRPTLQPAADPAGSTQAQPAATLVSSPQPMATPRSSPSAQPATTPQRSPQSQPAATMSQSSPTSQPAIGGPSSVEAQPVMLEPSLYVLRPGDNLTHLSAQYGTTIEAILSANGLTNANRIYSGRTLLIPSPAADATLQSPTDTPPTAAAPADADRPIASMPASAEGPAEAATYVVKRGDSAISIARRLGVDVDELLALNSVADRNRVFIGQTLTIPAA